MKTVALVLVCSFLLNAGLSAAEQTASPSSAPVDAQRTFLDQIRHGNIQAIQAVRKNAPLLEARDNAENTALMYAAFYLDSKGIELLLEKGANPNATNKQGASPLIWAVSDLEKVKVLLEHGAEVNAASASGNTPLIVATHQYGSAPVLKELLAYGADAGASNHEGNNALLAAAQTGDTEAIRLLLAHGADVNSARTDHSASSPAVSVLMVAVEFGHLECVKLLLDHGADIHFKSELGNALHFAAFTDRKDIARLLIERGAAVNTLGNRLLSSRKDSGFTPLIYAAMTERNDPTLVQLLIERGADVNARASSGENALQLARQRGETKVVACLRAAGAKEMDAVAAPPRLKTLCETEEIVRVNPQLLRKSVETAMNLLSSSSAKFTEETANRCFSCHHQGQPMLAWAMAKDKGLPYDKKVAAEQLNAVIRVADRRKNGAIEGPSPVPSIPAWLLISLHEAGYPGDQLTDAYAFSLARSQYRDGRWITPAARAPMDYSDVTSTALALWALKLYAPPTMKTEFEKRIAKAAQWLRLYEPASTEERALQILGLYWAGDSSPQLASLAKAFLNEQREDGGWAELPSLQSDAYATGLALYALNRAGGLAASHPAYQQGASFLLSRQLQDGSWHVPTRASPVQVAIAEIFSHGRDQWISTSATTWATMALALGLEHDP